MTRCMLIMPKMQRASCHRFLRLHRVIAAVKLRDSMLEANIRLSASSDARLSTAMVPGLNQKETAKRMELNGRTSKPFPWRSKGQCWWPPNWPQWSSARPRLRLSTNPGQWVLAGKRCVLFGDDVPVCLEGHHLHVPLALFFILSFHFSFVYPLTVLFMLFHLIHLELKPPTCSRLLAKEPWTVEKSFSLEPKRICPAMTKALKMNKKTTNLYKGKGKKL